LPLICEPELLQNVKIPCTIALCGPKGTGKFTLINAALQESKATLFNVTGPILTKNLQADQTAGGLLTNIFKFAKQIAPAVIYMDEVEAVFAKKAKEGQFDVRSLKKDLTKNLKALRPSDRVLFVGRSDQPWEADIKAMVPVFDRVIYTPKPDYSTRYRLWNEKLKKCDKPAGQVNTSLLASSSEGLTITQLIDTFHNVISKRTRNNVSVWCLNEWEKLTGFLATISTFHYRVPVFASTRRFKSRTSAKSI
jgi:SpoVK/Ycf46/Vps4 family AAA+-type ATPase